MGVNTLAFRGPQHRAFFDLDADCAALTPELPWDLAARWLDLVARSGTALFVSPDPAVVNAESKQALRQAFAAAARSRELAEPLDWMDTTTPGRWRIDGRAVDIRLVRPRRRLALPALAISRCARRRGRRRGLGRMPPLGPESESR